MRNEAVVHIEHPFGKGTLRSGGSQYCAEVADSTGSTATWVEVEATTIEPPARGKLVELEIAVTWSQKNSSTGSFVNGRIVARNKDGTYISIIDTGTSHATSADYVQDAAGSTVYVEHNYSGYVATTSLLDSVPFDVAVQVQREGTTGIATSKVKSSSYVKATYR